MKKFLPVVLLSFLFYPCLSQKEGNIWYFGNGAGLDFNSGTAVGLSNGQTTTDEGVATVCDKNGNLLFYTDGITVWNKNHAVMPNGTGLLGNFSATQSALIIPLPGSSTLYYVFTVGATFTDFNYSIVDITLQSGLGDVTTKNVLVQSTVAEKLCGVKHANKTDFWVIVHEMSTNEFDSYLFTSAGLNTTPVKSFTGINNTGDIGYLKASPLENKIASAQWNSGNLFELFDFDNTTGILSNGFSLPFHAASSGAYGVEFSPSGKYLYCTLITPAEIRQYDVTAGSQAAITASEILIGTSATAFNGALQSAPDGKIYVAELGVNHVGVINYPDSDGLACNFVDVGVTFSGAACALGLPNYFPEIFSNKFQFENTCFGDTTQFIIDDSLSVAGAQWNFDDPSSGVNNSSFLFAPSHYFGSADTFNVQVIKFYFNGSIDTVIVPVTIDAVPIVNLGGDTSFCIGSSYNLNAGSSFGSYLWQDGSTDSIFNATLTGTYYVTIKNGTCAASDTVTLSSITCAAPNVNFASSDTVWCDKKCVNFFDVSTNSPTSWQWYFPGAQPDTSTDQNPSNICYNNYGNFNVTLVACNAAGCDSITIPNFINEYHLPSAPVISLQGDTLVSTPAYSYQWYLIPDPIPGATGQSYVATQPGSYYVLIHDSIGCEVASNIIVIAGISNYAISKNVTVSSNPENESISISFKHLANQNADISLFNTLGQLILSSQFKIPTPEFTQNVNYSAFESGVYLLVIKTPENIYTKKLTINSR